MMWDSVHSYVMFLRYKRSGSALLVNLLDSHPNVVFVRNEELFAKWSRWGSPEQMFKHLYSNAKRYRRKPFSANGYSYPIEGVGYVDTPLVVGHKSSTRRMAEFSRDSDQFDAFQTFIGKPFNFIHLVRNPWDMVTARWQQKEFRRTNAPVISLVDHVIEQAIMNERMEQYVGGDVYRIYYEDLVANTEREMTKLASRLNIPFDQVWIDRCVTLVEPKVDDGIPMWTKEDHKKLEQMTSRFSFFERYL